MSKITIYEKFSRIDEEIKDNNVIYNVDGNDPESVFVIDSMGKLLDFKYQISSLKPFLDGITNGTKDIVTVTKGTKNFTGKLLHYDSNKIVLKLESKAVAIHNYDSVEFMKPPTLSSTVQIEEKSINTYPYRLIYESDKIKWKYKGIGLITKGENGIYNIGVTLSAHVYNNKEPKEYNITLATCVDKLCTDKLRKYHYEDEDVSKIEDLNYLNKESFYMNIGNKKLEQKVNVFAIKDMNLVAKKVYFHDYVKSGTLLGFRIKEIERLPRVKVSFYDYQGAGKLGNLYGVGIIGGFSQLKLADVIIRNSEDLKIVSDAVRIVNPKGDKVNLTISATNDSDEKVNLIARYPIELNEKFENLTCEIDSDYRVKSDHIEWQYEIFPRSNIKRKCVLEFSQKMQKIQK